jgi:Bax protein
MRVPWTSSKASLAYCVILVLFSLPAIYLTRERLQPIPEAIIEPLPVLEVVPDFASIVDVKEKKESFFNYIEPYVDQVNEDIIRQRLRVISIREKIVNNKELLLADLRYLSTLAEQYELEADDITNLEFLSVLLRRVDKIPVSLALAQAANESAWGTSRFAQDGNNFFGQWCYSDGCGLIPMRRREGATHEVRSFDSAKDSVQAYIHNLNTFPSYQMLRRIRQQLRRQNQAVDGVSLSDGLESYSSRGLDYIDEVQTMIYTNNLLARENPAL